MNILNENRQAIPIPRRKIVAELGFSRKKSLLCSGENANLMSKTKLVIFDLDGTLLDTIGDLAASCNHTMEQCGHPAHPTDAYRAFVGNGIAKLVERALPAECRAAEYVERVRVEFVKYYKAHIADFSHPYDGVPELLDRLAEQNIKLAVASNKFHEGTLLLIDRFFGCERFAAVYGQRVGVPIKPDPTVVEQIVAECGVARDEVLYVGDSGVDMRTAAAAGVRSVGVTWGFRSREELIETGATHLVDRTDEILKLL